MYDIIIVGMGISGITAGIYAKRSNKKVLLLDKYSCGGLLNNIDLISNYPGLINIKGSDFADDLKKQIEELDIPYKFEEAISYDLKNDIKIVKTTNNEYKCKHLIFAMGRKPKYLGIENEQEYLGKGLSTCAVCDAFFYKGKDVAVVGTGNSALQETLYLSNIVNKVYLLNRRDGFRGDEYLVSQIKQKENIEIIYNVNIKKYIIEEEKIKGVTLDNGQTLKIEGVFIYVGYKPDTDALKEFDILDEEGYINVSKNLETKIKNVYAIGDIIKKDVYQLVTAASDGAIVINTINKNEN